MESLIQLSCARLAAAIRERRTTCIAAMEAVLERAHAVQPRLNCFLRIDEDSALAAAHLADREIARGYVRGPLHGVPMAHKDMYYRRGVVSTCGSKILRDIPAKATARVLEHLDAAGAIQFGVLNMAEFAMGPTGHNWHYGHCRNPWDPERITGGSSSGSGAAVAARAAFAALGSDTGGSVRLPAAFCGIAGVRPTHSRVSVENILPLCPSLDTVGPLTRTVDDAALMLESIAPGFACDLEKPIAGLRIGRPRNVFYEGCDAEIAAAMEKSLDVFRRLGASVVDVELPDFAKLSALAGVLHAAEANPFHDEWFRTRPHDYSAQVRERLERGRPTHALDYVKALQARAPAITAFCEAVFSRVDLVHGPVVSFQTPTITETDISTGETAAQMLGRFVRLTRPISYLGLPVVVANAGFTRAGMPIGMQLIAPPLDEATALRAGHAFQRSTDWHVRVPPG
ncbi:MAG TPA: amidase [Burkholderiales bacterium]|nr:amidase [Burkholderiales bacterium]HSA68680.1 amidase [Burkholderiales bacterium]